MADALGRRRAWTLRRAPEGVSAVVYIIDGGDAPLFLRLAEAAHENLEIDALVHEKLLDLGVRVPRVVHVERRNERIGWSVMITEHIGGRPLMESPDSEVLRSVTECAGRDLAVINSIETDGFGWVVRQDPVWPPTAECREYGDFVVDDLPDPWPGAFAPLFADGDLATIEALIEKEQQRHVGVGVLAHGDLGVDHIFEAGGEYAGIIDFGELRGAEPEFDLGVFFMQAPAEGRPMLVDALLRGYEQVTVLPEDIRLRMRVSGTLKVLRQVGRWLQPDFPYERDAAAVAAIVRDRLLRRLRTDLGLS